MATSRMFTLVNAINILLAIAGFGWFESEGKSKVHASPVREILFGRPQSGVILSVDDLNEAKVTDVADGMNIRVTHAGLPGPKSIAIADNKYYATKHSASEWRLWHAQPIRLLSTLKCTGDFVNLNISPDGEMLVGVCSDGSLMVWKPGSNHFLAKRFSKDGKYIDATITEDNFIVAATTKNIVIGLGQNFDPVLLGFRVDDGNILSLDYDGKRKHRLVTTSLGVYAFDNNGNKKGLTCPKSSSVQKAIFSPDKKMFWLQFANGAYELRRSFDYYLIASDIGSPNTVYQWSPNGTFLYAIVDQHILIRSAPDFILTKYYFGSERSVPVTAAAFSQDETRLAVGYVDGWIKIWKIPATLLTPTESAKPAAIAAPLPPALKIILNVGGQVPRKITMKELNVILEKNPQAKIHVISRL